MASPPPTLVRSQSIHEPVSTPKYIRSQPIGLPSSKHRHTHSTSSMSSNASSPSSPVKAGLASSASNPESLSKALEDSDGTPTKERLRPPRRRHDSMPVFPPPPPEEKDSTGAQKGKLVTLETLPANPKQWLPSHLAVYLGSILQLPPPVQSDVQAFVIKSRLGGRQFLRLRPDDLVEMGVNVKWRKTLNEARERLRKEVLGGKVFWGFGGGDVEEPGEADVDEFGVKVSRQRDSSLLSVPKTTMQDEWKKSWKRLARQERRGTVRQAARAFEDVAAATVTSTKSAPSPTTAETPVRSRRFSWLPASMAEEERTRSPSVDSLAALSEASIDSGGHGGGHGSPEVVFEEDGDLSDASSVTDVSEDEQSLEDDGRKVQTLSVKNLMAFASELSSEPLEVDEHGEIRRQQQQQTTTTTASGSEFDPGTIRSAHLLQKTEASMMSVAELFGPPSANDGEEELVGTTLRAIRGRSQQTQVPESMVWVKRSDLDELKRRAKEVEEQLAAALSSTPSSASSSLASLSLDDLAVAFSPAGQGAADSRDTSFSMSPTSEMRARRGQGSSESSTKKEARAKVKKDAKELREWVRDIDVSVSASEEDGSATSTTTDGEEGVHRQGRRRRRRQQQRAKPSLQEEDTLAEATWKGLAAFATYATLGIAVVAGEVVVKKLFGIGGTGAMVRPR